MTKIKILLFIIAIALLVAFAFQIEGVTNFTGIQIKATSLATATPLFEIYNQGVGQSLVIRDSGGTPEVYVNANGALNANSIALADGNLTVADYLILTAQTAISVTDGGIITPTGSYQPLESGGAVTATLGVCGTAGRMYVFVNTVAQTIIITDASNTVLSGNASLGQYDTLTAICDGTRFIQIAPESDN